MLFYVVVMVAENSIDTFNYMLHNKRFHQNLEMEHFSVHQRKHGPSLSTQVCAHSLFFMQTTYKNRMQIIQSSFLVHNITLIDYNVCRLMASQNRIHISTKIQKKLENFYSVQSTIAR
jgi:hypothetical protein